MTDYFVPAVFILGGLLFGANAALGVMRGRLFFFEFDKNASVGARQAPALFLIGLVGSVLICLGALAMGIMMLRNMVS